MRLISIHREIGDRQVIEIYWREHWIFDFTLRLFMPYIRFPIKRRGFEWRTIMWDSHDHKISSWDGYTEDTKF